MKIWEVKGLGLKNLTLAEKNIKSIAAVSFSRNESHNIKLSRFNYD